MSIRGFNVILIITMLVYTLFFVNKAKIDYIYESKLFEQTVKKRKSRSLMQNGKKARNLIIYFSLELLGQEVSDFLCLFASPFTFLFFYY